MSASETTEQRVARHFTEALVELRELRHRQDSQNANIKKARAAFNQLVGELHRGKHWVPSVPYFVGSLSDALRALELGRPGREIDQ